MNNILLSNKIKIGSFICTIMVLYRHSLNYLAFFNSYEGFGYNKIIQGSMSIITEIAVPFFFMVSGLFFFKKTYDNRVEYMQMLRKKVKTLITPFVIWNIYGLLFIILYDINRLDKPFVSLIYDLCLSNWNGPLWYIRDLIILMIISPLYSWIYKINSKILYCFIIIVLLFIWMPVSSNLLSSESILFFFIGGIFSKNINIVNYKINKKMLLVFILIWGVLSFNTYTNNNLLLHKINILCGIIAFWGILDSITNNFQQKIIHLSKYSFIIYVMHAYIVKSIKNIVAYFYWGNEFVALLTYILLPIVTTILIIYISRLWFKIAPKFYYFATGNR